MLMQKHSPNSNNNNNTSSNNSNNAKIVENDDVNSNSSHSNGNFFTGRNASLAGSECNDDKSNDAGSSGDESHEQDNAEQENQTSFIDSSNRDQFKLSAKKKKKKTVKVKFSGSQDDKAGIKLKIRRTNNFNQDENHVIVDPADQQRKRHLKTKRNKSEPLLDNGVYNNTNNNKSKSQLEEVSNTVTSDDSLPQKRSRATAAVAVAATGTAAAAGNDSDDEMISKVSAGMNTLSKGTEIDESILGPCQAGSKLTLESVVLMETQSGILIVSVQWRGKTLMGALMESERFQIGTLEKDTIYRREKFMGMNRRNTRRKSKNLFGKKKRKTTTPPDPNDVGGTENEAGNSDVDNPYICDKENCHMKFSDFQALRIHIYQNHRTKDGPPLKEEPSLKIEASVVIKSEPTAGGGGGASVYVTPESLFPMLKHLRSGDCKPSDILRSDPLQSGGGGGRSRPSPLPEVVSSNQQAEERNSFSPAYSDISDANEAPVLENEAELKPPSSASQPPLNLSLCHNPSLHAANRLFSPTAPALQPEGLCSGPPLSNLRLSHDTKLPSLANYHHHRYPISSKFDHPEQPTIFANGYLHNLSTNHKSQNGVLSLHSSSGPPLSSDSSHAQSAVNSIQDLSMNSPLNLLAAGGGNNSSNGGGIKSGSNNSSNSTSSSSNNNHHLKFPPHHQPPPQSQPPGNHKTAAPPSLSNKSTSLHQSARHHTLHSHHHSITNGFPANQNSKHSASVSSSNQSENSISSNQTPSNGVALSHLPFMSFVTSVNSPAPKFNYPMSTLFHQPKF